MLPNLYASRGQSKEAVVTVTLTIRSGDIIETVTAEDVKEAVESLFSDTAKGRDEESAGEEPNIWISLGMEKGDDWVEHALGYYQGGSLIYTVYDNEEALDPSFEVQTVAGKEIALDLFMLLYNGKPDEVRSYAWDS